MIHVIITSIFHSQPLSGVTPPTSGGAQRAVTAATLSSPSRPLLQACQKVSPSPPLYSHPSPDANSEWKDVLLSTSADNRQSWRTNWLGNHLWVSWQPAFPLSPRQCHSNLKPNHSTHIRAEWIIFSLGNWGLSKRPNQDAQLSRNTARTLCLNSELRNVTSKTQSPTVGWRFCYSAKNPPDMTNSSAVSEPSWLPTSPPPPTTRDSCWTRYAPSTHVAFEGVFDSRTTKIKQYLVGF